MTKAKLTTRGISSTTVTSDNLAKGSQLTHNQLDSNFLNLRDATFGVVADDSATIQVGMDSTLEIKGGTNITTATDSGGVLTINAAAGTTLSGSTNNTITTVTGASAIQGEANLTFNGSTLAVTGAGTFSTTLGVTGASTLDGVTVSDNTISSNASNANLEINANGSGTVNLENLKIGTSGSTVTTILDEDAMGTDSATALATQQSIKAYIDAKVTAEDLDFQGDSGGALNIDLDSETLDIAGGTGIDTAGSSNTLTVAIDSTVVTKTGSHTLTNKTLTAPTMSDAVIDNVTIADNTISTNASNADLEISANGSGTIVLENLKIGTSGSTVTTILDEDAMGTDSATSLATQQSIKAYVDGKSHTALSGSTNNTITTVTGANAIQGESNLQFDGSTLAVTGNQTISGNLTVSGSTTTVATTNTTIEDNIIELNSGLSQSLNDSGIIIERGSTGNNACMIWDESADEFVFGTTTATGADKSGGITISAGDLKVADITATGGSITGITDLAVADGGTGASSLTSNAVLTGNGTSAITAEGNLSFDGSTLAVTGAGTFSTTLGVTGASTLDQVTITDNTISTNASNANLEINANGSGTIVLENLSVAGDGATVTGILDEDAMGSDSAVKLATQQSIKAYVDGKTHISLSGSTNNTVATVTGANALAGEANLQFDGSTLATTGAITATTNITATGTIGNDAVSITDNVVTTSRSNDNLRLEANGTGVVEVGDVTAAYNSSSRYARGVNIVHNNEDIALDGMTSGNARYYNNNTFSDLKLDGSDVNNSSARFRQTTGMNLDLNGSESTSTSAWSGAAPLFVECNINNSAGSTNLGRIGNVMNIGAEGYIYNPTSNITIDQYSMVWADAWMNAGSGKTVLVSDSKGFHYDGFSKETGGGTETITKETAFYGDLGGGATKYLIDTDADTNLSNIGTLIKYRETINSLTSSSTITVDCASGPIHTVTLTSNTEFNITNLGTGQSVTLIVTQDGGGTNTASWGTSGSTAVKFAGGTPTLSTAGAAIDVVTIFNDGTNYLGNIAKAYA